jgi:hypothetical protein
MLKVSVTPKKNETVNSVARTQNTKIQWKTFYAIRDKHFVDESQKLQTSEMEGGENKSRKGLRIVHTAMFKYKLHKGDLLCSYRTNDAPGQQVTYYGKKVKSKNKIPLLTTITIILLLTL